jgi:hypothetical protein
MGRVAFRVDKGSVRSVPEQTLTSITACSEAEHNHYQLHCSCFSSRAENLPAYQRGFLDDNISNNGLCDPAMMQVILVRHAETEWNVKGIIQGHSDSALTLRGERQTSALLAAFAESDYRVECVYASPLGRAWQMGQRLAERFIVH